MPQSGGWVWKASRNFWWQKDLLTKITWTEGNLGFSIVQINCLPLAAPPMSLSLSPLSRAARGLCRARGTHWICPSLAGCAKGCGGHRSSQDHCMSECADITPTKDTHTSLTESPCELWPQSLGLSFQERLQGVRKAMRVAFLSFIYGNMWWVLESQHVEVLEDLNPLSHPGSGDSCRKRTLPAGELL